MSKEQKEFLAEVIARDRNADGSDKGILRRMQCQQCQDCHKEFRHKHPEKIFKIKCQGVYDQADYDEYRAKLQADGDDMSMDQIREIFDSAFWTERHLVVKNDEGDIVPFVPRWYQAETMRCTSPRKVDRWGRGLGKTAMGVATDLHYLCTNKRTEIIVVCPAQSQAQLWWDEIMFQVENSPSFKNDEDFLLQKKQQPYLYLRFGNGSVLKIFTAGSKSGKGADAVRGSNPRRIRLDEQDYLSEKDYGAIMPLLRRFKKSTFHGSSTPTGLRGMYWQMCMKLAEYKEFFHPAQDHPEWGTEQLNEEVCFAEAKTMDRYRHEWLAEFGDPTAGVFKAAFVDAAMKPYAMASCVYNPNCHYVMGVDWNAKGTGTRIIVVEYNPDGRKRRLVAHAVVDDPKSTTMKSLHKIRDMNRDWHCDYVYIDAGFGFVQDEMLKMIGVEAGDWDPDTAKLKHIQIIDFGAKLETNRIVPNRDPESKYLPDPKDEELKRRTKPFMVEGSVIAFEAELVEISREFKLLEEQLRGYRVKTWTKGGQADTYETDAENGDHDLDAFMLAMLGIESHWGLWHTPETLHRVIRVCHLSGWGLPATMGVTPATLPGEAPVAVPLSNDQARDARREANGVPSRTPQQTSQNLVDQYRLLALQRLAGGVTMNLASQTPKGVTSRTSVFNSQLQPGGNRFARGSQQYRPRTF